MKRSTNTMTTSQSVMPVNPDNPNNTINVPEQQTKWFTTHSAHEDLRKCEMLRYLKWHHAGKGIVSSYKSIPLTTGVEIHNGIGHIVNEIKQSGYNKHYIKENIKDFIDNGVNVAKTSYRQLEGCVQYFQSNQSDSQSLFTYNEQLALIEALIRAWSYVELPCIIEEYKILEVEREFEYHLYEHGVLASRADWIMQHKSNGNVLIQSLKTMAPRWWNRGSRSLKKNLQVVTEVAAYQDYLREREYAISDMLLTFDMHSGLVPEETRIRAYLDSLKVNEHSVGVKFCILLKGDRYEDKTNQDGSENTWYTPSPLITGYKHFSPSGIQYAHTNKTIKLQNKTGYGRLGKDWEPFNVWDEESLGEPEERIAKWIELVYEGRVQGELVEYFGNVVKHQIISVPEIYPTEDRCKQAIDSLIYKENNFSSRLDNVLNGDNPFDVFEMNDRSCHWPNNCEMLPICWNENVFNETPKLVQLNRVPDGENYEKRVPHYKCEEKYR